MARRIKIFDTTLRDGEQSPGCSMQLPEKLEMAKMLERLGVDIIEAGFAVSSPGDFESVEEVSKTIKNCTVASLSRAVTGDIDAAVKALKKAAAPRIHIFLATSPLHMRYKLKMSESEVLERVKSSISYAKKFISDIEFSAEDAARSELPFLAKVFKTAIDSGATVINVPDTVGYCSPDEMSDKVKYLLNNVGGIEKVDISSHNHNDLGMAVASALAMVKAGATQIECTINGIGERAGNTSTEEVVMALKTRQNYYDAYTNIKTQELYRCCRLLSNITGVAIHPTKPIVGANAYAHESGIHQHGVLANPETYEIINPNDVGVPENKIVLGKHSGRHAFGEHCKMLGYEFDTETLTKHFENFKLLADKKKYVNNKDIEALLCGTERKSAKYAITDFSVENSKTGRAFSKVTLSIDGKTIKASAEGNGVLDSAFNAVNNALGLEITLLDYSSHSVSESGDAQSESVVKIMCDKIITSGRGISTDVYESGLTAYIDAVNKL